MKAISIRQPWAWLIVHGGKDIENRTWHTKVRGRVLVHAAKGMTRGDYYAALVYCGTPPLPFDFPAFDQLERGGIIGSVEIIDCVSHSDSKWFNGPFGFVLANPKPMPFIPFKGALGFFEVATQPCACSVTDLDGVCVECGTEVQA